MLAPLPAAEETVASTDMETENVREKRHRNTTHSYACTSKDNGECDSGPETPIKTGASKKKAKCNLNDAPLSLNEVQDNIIRALTIKTDEINSTMNEIKKLVNKNTTDIEDLKRSVEHGSLEVDDLKTENAMLKNKCQTLEKKVEEMEKKVNDADSYSRRMNLKIYGIPEGPGEDIRSKVMNVLLAVLPDKNRVEAAVDVVHRLGRHSDVNGGNTARPRPVIIRFSKQDTKDAIWNATKKNAYLKAHHLWFKLDLTAAVKERRELLWPKVDKARKENKVAYFVGARAFVNGKEIFPD